MGTELGAEVVDCCDEDAVMLLLLSQLETEGGDLCAKSRSIVPDGEDLRADGWAPCTPDEIPSLLRKTGSYMRDVLRFFQLDKISTTRAYMSFARGREEGAHLEDRNTLTEKYFLHGTTMNVGL